jgi:hypothetical protein
VIFTLIPFGQRTDSIDLFNFFEIYLGLYLWLSIWSVLEKFPCIENVSLQFGMDCSRDTNQVKLVDSIVLHIE